MPNIEMPKQMDTAALVNALPAFIEMPVENELEEPMFRALFGPKGATVAELRVAVNLLRDRLTEDIRQAEALNFLLFGVEGIAPSDDTRVSEVLQGSGNEPV